MTATIDTAFKLYDQFDAALCSGDSSQQLCNAFDRIGQGNARKFNQLWMAARQFSQQMDPVDSEDPQLHRVKLAILKLGEASFEYVNRAGDHMAELASLWPGAATTAEVIDFFEKNDCPTFAKVAKAAMRIPSRPADPAAESETPKL